MTDTPSDGPGTPAVLVVLTNPKDGRDNEFNRWYDDEHVDDVLAVHGVTGVQRYRLAPVDLRQGDDAPVHMPPPAYRYMAIYEIDRDADEVVKDLLAGALDGTLPLSDALDTDTLSLSAWQPHGRHRTRRS
jgi:hypothetical protein